MEFKDFYGHRTALCEWEFDGLIIQESAIDPMFALLSSDFSSSGAGKVLMVVVVILLQPHSDTSLTFVVSDFKQV